MLQILEFYESSSITGLNILAAGYIAPVPVIVKKILYFDFVPCLD